VFLPRSECFSRESEPEAPTRLAKQLAQLAAAALAIGVDENEAWRLIRKAGWDSVPAVRCAVIDCLARHEQPITLAEIQEDTGLPEKTIGRIVEDVVSLRLAKRQKDAGKWYVGQSAIARDYWSSETPPETSEGRQHPPEEAVLHADEVEAELDYYRTQLER
jgi:hypothetical protein